MAYYEDVSSIINGAAVECGLEPAVDVLASSNPAFIQLRYLLDAAGQELVKMADWQELIKEHSITTDALDSGEYALPEDFDHMINQTGWDRTNQNPLSGPASAQTWQYLKARDYISGSMFIVFRLKQQKFSVLPNNPVPDGINIVFEYIRNTWCSRNDGAVLYTKVQQTSDLVLFPPILVKKFLKVKFLEAKGFDSEKARDDFASIFDAATGQDKPAPVLNAGALRGFPYIDANRNVPYTDFGGP